MSSHIGPEHPGGDPSEFRLDPGSLPMGLVAIMALIIGLAVWQFGTLIPKETNFPSDEVDVSIRGRDIVVFNPTRGVIDLYQVTIQRLSGSYSYMGRNLRPRSSKTISLRGLRKPDGQRYDPKEDGECRIQLDYWRGTEKEGPFFRYCRGF